MQVFLGRDDLPAVRIEESKRDNPRCPLVSVDAWMISGETEGIGSGQMEDIWLWRASKYVERFCECRIKQRRIANRVRLTSPIASSVIPLCNHINNSTPFILAQERYVAALSFRFGDYKKMKVTPKTLLKQAGLAAGFDIRRRRKATRLNIPDEELYQPLFSPWRSGAFAAEYARISSWTLVSEERCYVLASLASQATHLDGEFWECGVYRGGTAMMFAERLSSTGATLRLFDTFEGMPETNAARDLHKAGDFSDTSLEDVRSRVRGDFVHFHKGLIPETFSGLESTRIAFAHVDVDIYDAILACCEFIYPRLSVGGFMVFDDYGWPSCPGARAAVDEFFRERTAIPLVLSTGQALVFKSTA